LPHVPHRAVGKVDELSAASRIFRFSYSSPAPARKSNQIELQLSLFACLRCARRGKRQDMALAEPIEPLAKQIARRLGGGCLLTKDRQAFELVLIELKEVRPRAGWLRFTLTVRDEDGQPARTPLMTGLISGGGRKVMPWFEGRIYSELEFRNGEQFDAREAGLEAELVRLIGRLVPAGGHLMLEYESPDQSETHRELLLRVPPAATYLGALMFAAGFRGHFKDWYISEGGHEGPRKLQANKSPNAAAAREALRSNFDELKHFIKRQLPQDAEDAALVARAQRRAHALLTEFAHTPKPRISARRHR
jgi:hypothetical protein